jgi:phosphohistidine phosphatase
MKHLLLVRHGKAQDHGSVPVDFDRTLVERGRRDVRTLAQELNALPFAPTIVLSSAAPRAEETAEILVEALNASPALILESALYLASAATLIRRIEALSDEHDVAVVVAHNPGIRDAASLLCAGFLPSFPTSGAVLFTFDCDMWAGCAYETASRTRAFFRDKA